MCFVLPLSYMGMLGGLALLMLSIKGYAPQIKRLFKKEVKI